MTTFKLTYYFFFIFLCVLFSSCTDNRERLPDNGNNSTVQKDWRIKDIIPGVWLPDEYIKRIESTKSPYKSSDALKEVAVMIIECDASVADSVVVGASWNNHEGYNFTLYFDSTNYLLTSIPDYDTKTNAYRLGYDIQGRDTFLILAHLSKDNRLIDQKKFRRVVRSQNDDSADWGLTFLVNDRLFRGQYERIDSTDRQQIVFSTSGLVRNFNNYKSYRVLTDFIGPTDYDNICFEKSESKYDCFSFKISGDTLRLFELVPTGEEDFEKVGNVKYTLIKTED